MTPLAMTVEEETQLVAVWVILMAKRAGAVLSQPFENVIVNKTRLEVMAHRAEKGR